MKKLELKHLAPYLPYGLKMLRFDGQGIDLTERFYSIPTAILQNYSPILRPLSDLTNETNGMCYWLLIEEIEMRKNIIKSSEIDNICVKTYNNLLENHFDVFNLIPNGLAIDINTLEL
jgi:hypothetical protein